MVEPKADTQACHASCRGILRGREDALLEEGEDWQERASQSRQVRQRQNPEEPSDLTSIRELLDEVAQDTHEGEHYVPMMLSMRKAVSSPAVLSYAGVQIDTCKNPSIVHLTMC